MNQCTGNLILNQCRNVEYLVTFKFTLEQTQRFLITFHLFRVKLIDSTTGLKIEKVCVCVCVCVCGGGQSSTNACEKTATVTKIWLDSWWAELREGSIRLVLAKELSNHQWCKQMGGGGGGGGSQRHASYYISFFKGICFTCSFVVTFKYFKIYIFVLPYMSKTVIVHKKKKSCCNVLQK